MNESLLQKKQKRSPENFFTLQQIGRYIFANLQQYSTTQLGNFFAPRKKKIKFFFPIPNTVINLIASPNTVIHTKTTRGGTTPNLSVLLTY